MNATVLMPRILQVGGGAVDQAAAILARLGVRRPLVVSDPYLRDCGLLAAFIARLGPAGEACGIFSDTVSDPTTTVIEEGARRFAAGGFDGLVAFGGGSPIDTAKAIGILHANGGRLDQYKVPNPIPKGGPPLLAVPTTAGTGSEVTRFTVVTDVGTDEKMLIAGPDLVPSAAIVDYELTLTCPLRLTADTGLDSLTHAIEAYVSRRANPFADAQALTAMAKIAAHIRTVCSDPGNRPAREQMMLAATLAGIAFSNASVALVHGMSRPIGAFFHVPHGLSNAMLLPAVTAFSLEAAPARYADCARAMGVDAPGSSDEAACHALVAALRQLARDLQVPTPRSYGIEAGRWDGLVATMAEQALASGSPANNPRVPTADEVVGLYRQCWDAA
jgi:alcohol dehydrogenase class IV